MAHGSRGSWVGRVMGHVGHGRVSSLMGRTGHGSRGTWVGSLTGQRVTWVTKYDPLSAKAWICVRGNPRPQSTPR